jgi:PEP-CTERM motif
MKHALTLAVLTLLLAIGLSPAAHAGTLFFTLSQPIQTGNPGDTLDFFADLETDDFVSVNSDTFSVESPLVMDDSGFFNDFNQFIFNGDFNFGLLFTITLPSNIPTGTYLGSFSIYGGDGADSQDLLDTETFSIATVNNNIISSVPEPSSLFLLGTGVTCIAGCKRKWRP